MIWLILALLLAAIVWYALRGRAWLKEQSWTQGFFAWIEPIETKLYQKSETMLVGRLLSVGGFLITAYDSVAMYATSFDLTPVTGRVLSKVPEDMRGLVVSGVLFVVGLLIAWLRKRTTKPLAEVAAE